MEEVPGIKPEAQEAPSVLTRASVLTQSSHEGLVNCTDPDILSWGNFISTLVSHLREKKNSSINLLLDS